MCVSSEYKISFAYVHLNLSPGRSVGTLKVRQNWTSQKDIGTEYVIYMYMYIRKNVKYIPIKSISNVSHYGKVSQTFPGDVPRRRNVYLKQCVNLVRQDEQTDFAIEAHPKLSLKNVSGSIENTSQTKISALSADFVS